MKKALKALTDLGGLTVAVIVLKISTTGGGLSLLGADTWLAIAGAVWVGVLEVAEEVSKAYLYDGHISGEDRAAIGRRIVTRNEKKK